MFISTVRSCLFSRTSCDVFTHFRDENYAFYWGILVTLMSLQRLCESIGLSLQSVHCNFNDNNKRDNCRQQTSTPVLLLPER